MSERRKAESETEPYRELLTKIEDFVSLIVARSVPDWITFHLSASRIASTFLASGAKSARIAMGF